MVQYIRYGDYETAHFDGEWIVLNTDNYTITKLNETGGFCWSLLSDLQSVETLSEAIFKQFNPVCDCVHCVHEDIKSFLDGLLECKLIKCIT